MPSFRVVLVLALNYKCLSTSFMEEIDTSYV
jgi:hypothetical protein